MGELVKGFKGFKEDGTCRYMQYETDKTYTVDSKKKLVCCTDTGLHFCIEPEDVWSYYPPGYGSKYAQVQTKNKCVGTAKALPRDSKRATRKLTIGSRFYGVFEYARNFFGKLKKKISTDRGAVYVGSGYAEEIGAGIVLGEKMCLEGNFVAGFCGHSAIKGDNLAFAEGYGNLVQSDALAIGINCTAEICTKNGIAITNSIAIGALGSSLVFISDMYPTKVYVFVVDGKKVKPGVGYYCCNGRLYEC